MKTTTLRILLTVTVLLLAAGGAFAVDPDPAPVTESLPTAEDGRHYAGIFDFARIRRPAPTCVDGSCAETTKTSSPAPVKVAAAAPAAAPAPTVATTATSRRFRPLATMLERVRTWYPGRAFARVRSAFGGC